MVADRAFLCPPCHGGRLFLKGGALLCDEPFLKRREGCEVLGPGGGFFGPDDVCQRGDGHLLASHLYQQGCAHQVLVAVGPARHEADVELTKLAGEVPDANACKGCSVVGEGKAFGYALGADPGPPDR